MQVSTRLSEGADRTIPLSELKKIKVDRAVHAMCIGRGGDDADDMDTEQAVQRIVSAISLDTSEASTSTTFKSALIPPYPSVVLKLYLWRNQCSSLTKLMRKFGMLPEL